MTFLDQLPKYLRLPGHSTPAAQRSWREVPATTAARIAASLVLRRIPSLRERIVSFDGGRALFTADLRTSLGLGIYRYGYEDPDLELLSLALAPKDVFVDGGANVGLFSLVAASRVGPNGAVVAFEPAPETRARLSRNRDINDFRWLRISAEALSNTPGRASFIAFGGNHSGVSSFVPEERALGTTIEVEVTTLDRALSSAEFARLRMVKLYLEGAEQKALLGAARTLERSRADWILEIEPAHLERQGSRADEIYGIFSRYGYRAYRAKRNEHGNPRIEPAFLSERGESPNILFTRDEDRLAQAGIHP